MTTEMKMKVQKLSKDNYYDPSTNWQWWSTSLFKDFEHCEGAALAKIKGEWKPTSSPEALLVGNYLHSFFESSESHEKFINDNHDSIYSTRTGKMKAAFKKAVQMIDTLSDDDFFNMVYQGDMEVPVEGVIGGVKWKGKLDCLNLDKGYFCDLKTVDDIHKRHWNNENRQWVSFVEDREYILQMAVYRELLKQTYDKDFEPFIFAVSKQDPPDKAAIRIDPWRYQDEMNKIANKIDHFESVKNGMVKPVYCGECEYCRRTKELDGFVEVNELMDD